MGTFQTVGKVKNLPIRVEWHGVKVTISACHSGGPGFQSRQRHMENKTMRRKTVVERSNAQIYLFFLFSHLDREDRGSNLFQKLFFGRVFWLFISEFLSCYSYLPFYISEGYVLFKIQMDLLGRNREKLVFQVVSKVVPFSAFYYINHFRFTVI